MVTWIGSRPFSALKLEVYTRNLIDGIEVRERHAGSVLGSFASMPSIEKLRGNRCAAQSLHLIAQYRGG